jgi:hypothetical protein
MGECAFKRTVYRITIRFKNGRMRIFLRWAKAIPVKIVAWLREHPVRSAVSVRGSRSPLLLAASHIKTMKTFRTIPFLLLMLLLRLAEQPVGAVVVTDGLIHLWHMDETAGSSVADSIGSWNLQLQGGATLGAPGIQGSSVRLDGVNDFLVSAPSAVGFIASDFTLSLWVHWTSVAGKPGLLQFKSDAGYRDLSIDLTYAGLQPQVDANSGSLRVPSSVSIADDQWHLLSVVRQGTIGRLYLDAFQAGTGIGTLTQTGTREVFELGRYDASHFFGGMVDEAAIYNRALSPAEIALNVPEPGASALLMLGVVLFLPFARRSGVAGEK